MKDAISVALAMAIMLFVGVLWPAGARVLAWLLLAGSLVAMVTGRR